MGDEQPPVSDSHFLPPTFYLHFYLRRRGDREIGGCIKRQTQNKKIEIPNMCSTGNKLTSWWRLRAFPRKRMREYKRAIWEMRKTREQLGKQERILQILTCTECLERLSPNLLAVATFWKGCLQIKFTLTTSIASIHSPVQSVWPLTSWWSTLLKLTQKIPRYDINSSFEGV